MCIFTDLANIKNPSDGVRWASVVILILFNIVNGFGPIWLGESPPSHCFRNSS